MHILQTFPAMLLLANARAEERVTYFKLDGRFATDGVYDVCPQVEFGISTCQDIYPDYTAVCKGPGGYLKDASGPPVIGDPDVTICCSTQLATLTAPYVNATAFLSYLQGLDIGVLATIGCDFSSTSPIFLSLSKFKRIEIKSPNGQTKLEIDTEDMATQNWVKKVSANNATARPSTLHVDQNIFNHGADATGDIAKSFSFVDPETGNMTTVTYFGT